MQSGVREVEGKLIEQDETSNALVSLLIDLKVEPGKPVLLLDVVTPLLAQGYSRNRIIFTLYMFKVEKLIHMTWEHLVLLKPLNLAAFLADPANQRGGTTG